MVKTQSLLTSKKVLFTGLATVLSGLLLGLEASILTPKTSASPGFFEYQWDPEPGYKRLKFYQSSSERLDRSTYYFFLRGKERKDAINKLSITVPEYFDAKIKTKNLSLCKVKVGGYTGRTRCINNLPAIIEVNSKQTSIEIFPETPIPTGKDSYALVMKIFNPRKRGMFQFQAISQGPADIPISTYLGTWNINIQ